MSLNDLYLALIVVGLTAHVLLLPPLIEFRVELGRTNWGTIAVILVDTALAFNAMLLTLFTLVLLRQAGFIGDAAWVYVRLGLAFTFATKPLVLLVRLWRWRRVRWNG